MKSNWVGFQSCAAPALDRYVAYKRALRRRFRSEERELRLLDRFLLDRSVEAIEDIQPELIDTFLASRPRRRARSYNHLVGVVRCFFDWLVTQGLLGQSPVGATPRRETDCRIPFLFNPAQARHLLDVADHLPDRNGAPLRGTTYRTIFALLYGLGLRVGEVSRLCCKDVDRERQLLVIRETKFSKSRLVPFGPRLAAVIAQYMQKRAQPGGILPPDAPLFSFRKGRPVSAGTISQTFHHLWPRLGFPVPAGVAPPRVHDLRHAFAVATLLRWYREGIDPSTRLLHLSTFLGHVNPDSTAVYLTITAELFQEANRRFEQFVAPSLTEVRP
jgi:site-specific recombinase XerD